MIKTNLLNSHPQSIFILAGEESADNHGAKLIKAIQEMNAEINFIGIGGKKMNQSGLRSLEPIKNLAVMGFVEVVKHLRFFRKLSARILQVISKESPSHIILIDYPGFNLRLAKKIKQKFNIPITYYISPQLWAWKESRVKIVQKYIDQMLVIFPFEESWYRERGVTAYFTGHPMLDDFGVAEKGELCKELQLESNRPIITLYPGSRQQEVEHHLPIMIQAAQKLIQDDKTLQFVLGAATNIHLGKWEIPKWLKVESQKPRKALKCADLAITASGTATVEAAIFETPVIIVYKMAVLSWWLSKIFIKVPYAGMVNIIAGKKIMPELLQGKFTAKYLKETVQDIFYDEKKLSEMKEDLRKVKKTLKGKGASHNAAEKILEYMS